MKSMSFGRAAFQADVEVENNMRFGRTRESLGQPHHDGVRGNLGPGQ